MIQIAICDDDPIQLKQTSNIILGLDLEYRLKIELFSDGEQLISSIENLDYRPDILLLDIVLPESSGIQVAARINQLCPDCAVIYLTAFLSYATDVYETRHSYFIIKSQLKERIGPALSKAISGKVAPARLSFRESGTIMTLPLSEVMYLERRLKKTFIVCRSGRQHTTNAKPAEILSSADCRGFIRCHQSYHVNPAAIRGINTNSFILDAGLEIPISRSCYKTAKDAFLSTLSAPIAHALCCAPEEETSKTTYGKHL